MYICILIIEKQRNYKKIKLISRISEVFKFLSVPTVKIINNFFVRFYVIPKGNFIESHYPKEITNV